MTEGQQDKLAQIVSGVWTTFALLIGFWFVYDKYKVEFASFITQNGLAVNIAIGAMAVLGAIALPGEFFFDLYSIFD